jgi:hypothetical protein
MDRADLTSLPRVGAFGMQFKLSPLVNPRGKLALVAIAIGLVLLFIQFSTRDTVHNTARPKMGLTHIVLFQFKSSASPEAISDVCGPHALSCRLILMKLSLSKISQRMLALKDSCIHPTSNKPYIVSASGGIDDSPEGIQVMPNLSQMEFYGA